MIWTTRTKQWDYQYDLKGENTVRFLFVIRAGKQSLTGARPSQSASYSLRRACDLFAWFMGSERLLLRHMEFPFGHSLIAMARA